ncbi:MAG: T9SS type A sorting domain-containing protein, partial [Bacteroidota bacterium]
DIGCFESNYGLPVSLISLGASLINKNTVEINWETATELNNKGWEIERTTLNSGSELSWTSLGFTDGMNNSNYSNKYSFTDNKIEKNATYVYRLKQVDYEGNYVYSNIVTIATAYSQELHINAFPNPAKTSTTLQYTVPKKGIVSLNLYTMCGVPVKQLITETMEEGTYNKLLPLNNLAAGNYIVRIQSGKDMSYVTICLK